MAEVTFNVTPATPQKRFHDGTDVIKHIPAATSATKPVTEPEQSSRQDSPTPSTSSSMTELTGSNDPPGSAVKSVGGTTTARPTKKRKLGLFEAQAEKAAKQREKEERARQKADDKARKDDERRRAAEEKENTRRTKELEKAEKQRAKDEEKQKKDADKIVKDAQKAQKEAEKKQKEAEKEAEKQKKEAEQLRKERSQMRLGRFFGKPKTEATPPSTPEDVSEGGTSRRSSIASINMEIPMLGPPRPNKPSNPEYESFILPFFVPDYTDIAPSTRLKLSRQLDFEVAPTSEIVPDLHEQFGRPRKRLRRSVPVKEIIRNMQATEIDVIDLDSNALNALAQTSYKILKFREDVRPPYQGTYTRPISPRSSRKVSRNPFTRGLPDINYDYDSEAEWEPPGEDDEDLEDDDEVSDADEAGDEMNDFLDDVEDIARKKGPVIDMEPVSSGLCFVGRAFNDNGTDLEQYRMDFLHDSTAFPIDPYATNHWTDELKSKPVLKQETTVAMQPPRQPLSSLSPNATPITKSDLGIDGKPIPPATQKSGNHKPLKVIEPELMASFKQAIAGSKLTKVGLIEVLKTQFPKCSKDAIKDTLGAVAVRVGKKEAEKRWQLVDTP